MRARYRQRLSGFPPCRLRALRRHDPPPRRGGPDRHRALGPGLVQPASVDLRLGRLLPRLPQPPRGGDRPARAADEPHRGGRGRRRTSRSSSTPASSCLGRTLEWVELPDDIVARIEGKSSIGRLGLIVHATAGFVDPGFKGTLTLEITNLTRVPDQALRRAADRPAVVHDARRARRAPVRLRRSWARTTRARWRPPRAATCGSLPPVLHALTIVFAPPRREESSKTLFYIAGGLLAVFAARDLGASASAPRHVPGQHGARRAA